MVHRYWPKLRADYINTFIILLWCGWLSVGINSSLLPYFTFGFFVMGYVKKKRPAQFARWHLTTVAGIAGGMFHPLSSHTQRGQTLCSQRDNPGTSIIIFILTFAVSGGSGVARPFPEWWGNNLSGNVDHCLKVSTD